MRTASPLTLLSKWKSDPVPPECLNPEMPRSVRRSDMEFSPLMPSPMPADPRHRVDIAKASVADVCYPLTGVSLSFGVHLSADWLQRGKVSWRVPRHPKVNRKSTHDTYLRF